MSNVVYKYRVPVQDTIEVVMPVGAQVLHVGLQNDEPHIWVRLDPTARLEVRTFRWVGTGHPFERLDYIGTVHTPPFVWHLFESK